MHRRTACIDSPVHLSGATPAAADSAESEDSHVSAGSRVSVQGTPPQSAFQTRDITARPMTEPEHGPPAHGMQHPGKQTAAPAGYRPRSIAQKAGMNVWSRHGSRYGWPSDLHIRPYLSAPPSSITALPRHGMTWWLHCQALYLWGE